MANLKFRMFTWPEDPEIYSVRAVMSPLYTIADDGTISYRGMGPLCRVISGSGVFQGSKAVSNFNALSVIMATGQVGELIHPQWGTMSVYLTELKMQQESREDYIAYSFVFREAHESGSIPKLPEQE